MTIVLPSLRDRELSELARMAVTSTAASWVRIEDAAGSVQATAGDPPSRDHPNRDWSAPLIFSGRVLGTMSARVRSDALSDEERHRTSRLLGAFAVHVATALVRLPASSTSLDGDVLSRVAALAEATSHADGLRSLTARVSNLANLVIGSTDAAIAMWDDDRAVLKTLTGAFGLTGHPLYAMGGPGVDLRSNAARVFRTQHPYVSNQAVGDPGIVQSFVLEHGLSRVLSVPLMLGDRCTGVLHLVNKPSDFTPDDLLVAEQIAPWVSIAVALARSVNTLRVQQTLEAVLADAAQQIALASRAETALLDAFRGFADVMCASAIALIPVAGPPIVWRRDRAEAIDDSTFLADAPDAEAVSTIEFATDARDPGSASFHSPVHLGGERVATMSLVRNRGVPFAPHEVSALSRLGSLAALAVVTRRNQQQRIDLMRLQERQRIADDLHDRVAQILFTAQLGLDTLLELGPSLGEDETRRIGEVRSLLTKGDTVIRDVIHELAPVPSSPTERLRAVVLDVEEEFAGSIDVNIDAAAAALLEGARRQTISCLLKVTREATVNALKHARASVVTVRLTQVDGGALRLTVTDDGRGLSGSEQRSTPSYGLPSMRRSVRDARGTLAFSRDQSGHGTRVIATLPL